MPSKLMSHLINLKQRIKYVQLYRCKSSLGFWQDDINTSIKLQIEKHWRNEVLSKTSSQNGNDSFYVLPMFPYPSGNLHMGHVRVYSISDTIARFQSLCGKNVIHPIGWDAFGLPAENAAIERNIPPDIWTHRNIEAMKRQLLQLAFNFDWSREIKTCDPKYYKWTQYIFLKLLENGLAYRNRAIVNWDPIDMTVLADEQVDEQGRSWRSGAKVEKRNLTQWFIKSTKFSKSLYDGLSDECLENWKDIVNLQKHWIGECNGIVVEFKHKQKSGDNIILDVWTGEPYKLIHGQFLTISNNHALAQELFANNIGTKTNPLKVLNPITEAEIPMFVLDHTGYPEGRDIYLASPSTDDFDKELAKKVDHHVSEVPTAFDVILEGKKAVKEAQRKKAGGYYTSSKLRDWLISRQRYWGTPIPIIHCKKCGAVPVPYEQLPVKLPESDLLKSGIETLAKFESWVNCKCPRCQADAQRETDTMDTFMDSSWYYYRFLDPKNTVKPFDLNKLSGNSPVHMYIGGKEHAVLHLYYARFMSHFLHSIGWTPHPEPFKKLVVQGMVMGQSYKLKSGKYLPPENVQKVDNVFIEKGSEEPVTITWEKMSKSKYNGENPERLLSEYGCDTTRLFILADVPPATTRQWSDATFPGVLNWQHRLWMTIRDFLKHRNDESLLTSNKVAEETFRTLENKIWNSRNYFTATTTFQFRHTQQLSVGISRLQGLTSTLRNNLPPEVIARSSDVEMALAALIIMLSPVAPHFCSELWAGLQSAPNRICHSTPWIDWNKGVLDQIWPTVDDNYELSFLCKVDGADRSDLKIQSSELLKLTHQSALDMMLKKEPVIKCTKRGILHSKFDLYPGCRAILNIFTNRKLTKEKKVAVVESK